MPGTAVDKILYIPEIYLGKKSISMERNGSHVAFSASF
jgi:hypothetical protein